MQLDCHCHILPLLDDGASCLEESIELARKQVSWGFERAVCTSHRAYLYRNTPDTVRKACDRLKEALEEREIPLELVPSMEFQMNYFRQVLRKNLKHSGRRIVFIHGVGDGTLAAAIRKELDEVYAISCSYTFGPMGVTNVTIR